MTDFDLKDYMPQPNNWFETEIVYEGRGRAEFNNSVAWAEGHTVIRVDEIGQLKAHLIIDISWGEFTDFCTRLIVTGSNGEIIVKHAIVNHRPIFSIGETSAKKIIIDASSAVYSLENSDDPFIGYYR